MAARAASQSSIIFTIALDFQLEVHETNRRRREFVVSQTTHDEKKKKFRLSKRKEETRVTHWFPLHRHLNHKLDKTEQRMNETSPTPAHPAKVKHSRIRSYARLGMIRLNSLRNRLE